MKCKIHSTSNAGHSCLVQTLDSEFAVSAAVDLEQWRNHIQYCKTIGTLQTHGRRSTFWQLVGSIPLLVDNRLLEMRFCEWPRHQCAANGLLHKILWTKKHVPSVTVWSELTRVASWHGIILVLSVNMATKYVSVSTFVLMSVCLLHGM